MGRVKLTNDYYSENFDSFQQQTNKTMDMNEEKWNKNETESRKPKVKQHGKGQVLPWVWICQKGHNSNDHKHKTNSVPRRKGAENKKRRQIVTEKAILYQENLSQC